MTTTHAFAERLRARADEHQASADWLASTPAMHANRVAHQYAARILREEAAALDALTPDPALGEVEQACAFLQAHHQHIVDLCSRAEDATWFASLNRSGEAEREIEGATLADCIIVTARALGFTPTATPPVDLRREVAERIAREVRDATVAIEARGTSAAALDLTAILDKHLSADDEERAAVEALAAATLDWLPKWDAGHEPTQDAAEAVLREKADALRAVRARRK